MAAPETSRTREVPRWSLVVALAVGAGLGAGWTGFQARMRTGTTTRALEAQVAQAGEARDAAQLEAREARMAFRTLAEEHARLQDEVDALQARLDETDPGLAGGDRPSDVMLAALNRARIVDVSEDLGYVVFDAGARDGIRAGMVLSVVRDDRVIARVRASDVKEKLTGASVEETEAGSFPQAGDRMVLAKGRGA
jgi:hypothetical protein